MKIKHRKNPKQIIIFMLAILILVFSFVIISKKTLIDFDNNKLNNNVSDLPIKSIVAQRQEIKSMIENLGAEKTLSLIENEFGNNYTVGHLALHLFGEELYLKEGPKGITSCNEKLGFGCFHGFSTTALEDRGIKILPELEKVCQDSHSNNSLACLHGLGHGLIEYFGHTNIVKALDACSSLSWKGRIHGCSDGVFMEYFLPNLLTDNKGSQRARDIEPNKPYGICPSLRVNYQVGCFYSLPLWWWVSIGPDFSRLGNLCSQISEKLNRNACFLGIGNIIPSAVNFGSTDVISMASNCTKMPTLEGEVACRSGVFGILSQGEHKTLSASKACMELPKDTYNICLKLTIIKEVQGL